LEPRPVAAMTLLLFAFIFQRAFALRVYFAILAGFTKVLTTQ
jgi:hypothetical protein